MTKKLFDGAHQSRVDVDTAARVIGYSSSSGGAAASAIGALRQFGLVDGLRGDIGVSELAMKILQPLDDKERDDALREAAAKPEVFGRVLSHFSGKLPSSNEPVKAFLIRNEGFSAGGAGEMIEALRETLGSLPDLVASNSREAESTISNQNDSAPRHPEDSPQYARPMPFPTESSELIVLPLGSSSRAELRFVGEVTSVAYGRLIRHLELLRDMLVEDQTTEIS